MKWEPVRGPGIKVVCQYCGHVVLTWDRTAYANVHGRPFQEYACEPCAVRRGAEVWQRPPGRDARRLVARFE